MKDKETGYDYLPDKNFSYFQAMKYFSLQSSGHENCQNYKSETLVKVH